jgi:kumamolisin
MKINSPDVTWKSIDGAQNRPSNAASADGQVQLDIEIVGSVAPKAKIVVYFSPNTDQGYTDAVKEAVGDHPGVLLTSWGETRNKLDRNCDSSPRQRTPPCRGRRNHSSRGVWRQWTYRRRGGWKPHVSFPASSPWVLAVGGTMLEADGTNIRSEVVWNNLKDNEGATGTGFRDVFRSPIWQQTILQRSKFGRSVPDVSINASPQTGYQAIIDGTKIVIGGTSAGGPLWAGLAVLLNQGLGKNIGYFNPILYRRIGMTDAFNPIPRGQGIQAERGWTTLTGWGSPDGKKLLATLHKLGTDR